MFCYVSGGTGCSFKQTAVASDLDQRVPPQAHEVRIMKARFEQRRPSWASKRVESRHQVRCSASAAPVTTESVMPWGVWVSRVRPKPTGNCAARHATGGGPHTSLVSFKAARFHPSRIGCPVGVTRGVEPFRIVNGCWNCERWARRVASTK